MIALVTGGGGFLGRAIVHRLVERGDTVRILSRGDYPDLRKIGVETFQGDIADPGTTLLASNGSDVVFHVAAKAGLWGSREAFRLANVEGTRNVIAACRKLGIGKLVFTSSPSVVHSGGDIEGADESLPYPTHYDAFYPETKAKAERLVLGANEPDLATVALRPHLIWGPGDNHLIPRIIARAKAGRLRRIGNRLNRVDSIYIDNAADVHIRAADQLSPRSKIAGKAYFVSQGDPWPLWDLVNGILKAARLKPVTRSVPTSVAWLAGATMESIHRTFNLEGEPLMTRFLVHQLSTAHWFNIEAVRRDLGFTPKISIDEGLRRLGRWFDDGRASTP